MEPFVPLSEHVDFWQGELSRHEQTNVGIIRAGRSAVVIDANFAPPARRIVASIEERHNTTVGHLVNTHYHADHTLGNSVFVLAGAIVVGASGQRSELLAKGREDALQQTGEEPSRLYPAMVEFDTSMTFCEYDLELIAVGPAHSAADLIAWLPDDRILFVGDLAVAWEHGSNFSDPDADIDGWIAALDRCSALEPEVVIPAHGRLSTADVLREQRDFMVELWGLAMDTAAGDQSADRFSSDATVAMFLDRHPSHVVDAPRFREMASSMLKAAQKKLSA